MWCLSIDPKTNETTRSLMALSQISLNLKTCRYLLKFSYIGTKYHGLQRQSRRTDCDYEDGTIQCALERALNKALMPIYGSRLAVSSRTDAGVHAYQNTANVDLTHPFSQTIYKPSFITKATNRVLVYRDEEITTNAQWRSYVYRIAVVGNVQLNRAQQILYRDLRSYLPLSQMNRCHIVSSVDIEAIQNAINFLKGEHDFASFCTKNKQNKEKSTVKTIDEFEIRPCYPLSEYELRSDLYSHIQFYEFYVKSKSFLYNQVRRMVGVVIDVGIGRLSLEDVQKMLELANHRPNLISEMVPACGLYLSEVRYCDQDLILHNNFMEYAPKAHYHDDTFGMDSDLDE